MTAQWLMALVYLALDQGDLRLAWELLKLTEGMWIERVQWRHSISRWYGGSVSERKERKRTMSRGNGKHFVGTRRVFCVGGLLVSMLLFAGVLVGGCGEPEDIRQWCYDYTQCAKDNAMLTVSEYDALMGSVENDGVGACRTAWRVCDEEGGDCCDGAVD
jgi:hypothetical protein